MNNPINELKTRLTVMEKNEKDLLQKVDFLESKVDEQIDEIVQLTNDYDTVIENTGKFCTDCPVRGTPGCEKCYLHPVLIEHLLLKKLI